MPEPVEANQRSRVERPIVHRIRIEATIACTCNPLQPLFVNAVGTYGAVSCPTCGRTWRMNFLHFDEDDALAPKDANGQPSIGFDFTGEQGIVAPGLPTRPRPM
jgi:hypothetical protein